MSTVIDTPAPSTPESPRPGGAPPPRPPAGRPGGGARRDGLLVVVYVLAAMALLSSMVAVGLAVRAVDEAGDDAAPATGAAEGAPTSTAVTLADLSIRPAVVEVAAGGVLEVTNSGAIRHDLMIEGEDLAVDLLDPGASGTLDLSGLEPGSYVMFCGVPGHRAAGMQAELEVLAGGTATAGTMDHAAGGPMTADEMDEVMAATTKAFPAATEGKGAQLLAPTVLADGTKQFDLTTRIVQWEVEPGKRVEAWTYNGTVPGPTIKVDPGDKVRVVLENELPESTVIHFHGIDIPNALDGVPDITQPPVKPGQSYTYEFTAQDTPAVAMYHSHHNAAKQVSNGLAAAFLVGSEPVPAGVHVTQEHVMMLNDAGTIGYSLNGKSFPATEPYVAERGEWIQVHYMNEGVMAHPMHLHGLAQTVIAKDGYPVPQPYRADTVMVGPGERYTVLVQATAPGTWAWHCHILPHAERETGMFGMVTALIVS
ncbi:MAG: multicopper oxidase domain-containing protein [Actinomycetota bacterium]